MFDEQLKHCPTSIVNKFIKNNVQNQSVLFTYNLQLKKQTKIIYSLIYFQLHFTTFIELQQRYILYKKNRVKSSNTIFDFLFIIQKPIYPVQYYPIFKSYMLN